VDETGKPIFQLVEFDIFQTLEKVWRVTLFDEVDGSGYEDG
jgi:hypothetical protein